MEKLLKDKKAMNEKKVAIEVAIPMLTILKQLHAMKIIHRCAQVAACWSALRRMLCNIQASPTTP